MLRLVGRNLLLCPLLGLFRQKHGLGGLRLRPSIKALGLGGRVVILRTGVPQVLPQLLILLLAKIPGVNGVLSPPVGTVEIVISL